MAEKGDSPYSTDLSEIIEADPVTPEEGDSPYEGGGLSPLATGDSQTFLEYLQGLVSIETGLRSSGDSTLQDNIDAEETARISTDSDLQDQVTPNTTHRSSDGKDHSDVVLNNTHRSSDGKDHSDVVLNNTHRGSDGVDHTYIDQDVRTTATVRHSSINLGLYGTDMEVDHKIESWTRNGYTSWINFMEATTFGMGIRYDASGNKMYFHRYESSATPIEVIDIDRTTGIANFAETPTVNGTNVELEGHEHTASEVTDFDTEVSNNTDVANATSHITDNDKHREINDSGTGTTDLWSANKIASAVSSGAIPVGFIYIQLPGESTPVSLFGGTWSNISSTYAGNFFRAEGGDASTFEAGTQEDAMQRTKGTASADGLTRTFTLIDDTTTGVFTAFTTTGKANTSISSASPNGQLNFDNSANGTYKTNGIGTGDGETRPTNETVRIWKRTA